MPDMWNHGLGHYRCTFAADYAATRTVQHPKTIYVREDVITPRLDAWTARIFDPAQLEATCQALAEAQEQDSSATTRVEAARKRIADL
jgi:site-specific DNA recombinase